MPDENRFSGLGDVVEEPEPESEETADAEESVASDEPESESEAEASAGPAFEFEDATAKSVYVRSETLSVMDDAEFEVESLLRREHDVRDVTGREFHDALVRVAADHYEEVAERILSARESE